MNLHHVVAGADNMPENLITVCVACHAVLHVGISLDLGLVEIWQCDLTQTEIVRRTREGIRGGLSLAQINQSLDLTPGVLPPESLEYANELVRDMGTAPRASLPEPLSAVFVNLSRWQLE